MVLVNDDAETSDESGGDNKTSNDNSCARCCPTLSLLQAMYSGSVYSYKDCRAQTNATQQHTYVLD